MVPVASVEKELTPKSFVAYKSPSGKSRKLTNQLSLTFGFCSHEWTEYPCSGVDACPNFLRAVLDVPHTALEPGDADQYAVYEKVFEEASADTPSTNTEQQALAREWAKYTSVVVPFILKPCPNVLCARLEIPPRGKVVTIQASGRKCLGCSRYSRANRMGHKNASISSIQDLGNIERWLSEERDVTNIPAGVNTNQPFVSDATAYIFPAFFESNVRRVANCVVAIETDEYYKAVESVGLSQDGNFFVLAISATINNKGVTLARFFIQRATQDVARTCYKLFFQEVLKINPRWAPWHVLVLRQLSVINPTLDGAPSAAVLQLATENVRRMSCSVLVGVTMDFSASLAGGLCDALEDVGFDEFSVDEHAQSILFGCKAHAHRVCERAPLSVRATLRKLIACHNVAEAERLRASVIQTEPTRDCAGVLGNARLLPAFCPAFSKADHAQRAVASTTTNAEESQHERVYKLCGRRQPLMVAMTGSKFVDQQDADELDHGRAAGVYTALERAHHSQRRREKRKQATRPRDGGRFADDVGAAERGDEGDAAAGPPPKRRRRAVRAIAASNVAAELRIAELEKQLLEQRNWTLEAKNAALRAGAMAGGSGSAVSMAPTVGLPHHPGNAAPPAWFVNLMTAASQLPESTPPHVNDVTTARGNGGVEAP
ncbi:hypothetical protein I4F81_008700 [Pyropia yezoensis]|uniref:Uncharacterized protein n=1 Tax=Pyropia yezoensis TaxID=2788 RepID=A0ACC3C871_PYRYE|nr:hypothetical protein I4F81_008700 [Neopyropia yezoensis]